MTTRRTSQAKSSLNNQQYEEIISVLQRDCSDLSKGALRVLGHIIAVSLKHGFLYAKVITIAKKAELSERQVQRILKILRSRGLIEIEYKRTAYKMNKPSRYRLSDFFKVSDICSALSHLFPILKPIALAFLLSPSGALFGTNVTLLNSPNNKNIYINNGRVLSYCKSEPVARVTDLKITLRGEKWREYMGKEVIVNPISVAIRDIKSMKLTKWGQILLSAFPDDVIRYVEDKSVTVTAVKNRFGWFMQVAKRECEYRSIKPNWSYVKELEERYKMPYNAPALLKKSVAVVAGVSDRKENKPMNSSFGTANNPYKVWENPHKREEEDPQKALDNIISNLVSDAVKNNIFKTELLLMKKHQLEKEIQRRSKNNVADIHF